MRIEFLGAAGTVTGSKYLVEAGRTRVLDESARALLARETLGEAELRPYFEKVGESRR